MTQRSRRDKSKHAIATSLSGGLVLCAMTALTLDPFGYWPANRSRIRPLGGPDKGEDPNYVFHTDYVAATTGPSLAEVAFRDLSADTGMIAVRIFQHLPEGRPAVTEQGKMTALLPSIAKTKRTIKVPFEAVSGARYAVTGYVFGECEAHAKAIDITIAPRTSEADDPTQVRSRFGRLKARRASALAANDAPRLSWPVSQGFTPDQTGEPDFLRVMAGVTPERPAAERWETAYIVRVLEQYGRLEAGARGLALSLGPDAAAALVAKSGCDIRSVVLASGQSIADACAQNLPGPDEGRGFDFVWSRSALFDAGDSTRALGLIEELLDRIRPGGLAVPLMVAGPQLDRNALSRIMLGVAAMGHLAAQLRFGEHGSDSGPFGFVVRRSTDDLIA